MVLPLLLGPLFTIFSVADAGVWLASGKDIIHHVTGVDVLGTILGLFGIKDGPDYSGVGDSLNDISSLIVVAVALIVFVGAVALLKPKKKKRRS